MSSPSILWYFADPMCSWCWGFSPVIEQIRATYDEQLNIALLLGGLRPGTSDPLSTDMRTEILQHWHEVHKMTGQSFSFEGAMPEGFIYDTEPACRAVVAVAEVEPALIFPFFRSLQAAFYVDQIDVTKQDSLLNLAQKQGVAKERFVATFNSQDAKQKVRAHFQATRQAGVNGFPSLVLQRGEEYQFIARGYRPFVEISPLVDSWLEQHPD